VKYDIRVLPVAEKDIRGAAMYIALDLKAPQAAANFVREIRKKAQKLCDMPYMYREYHGEPRNETVYRAMQVKNYIVFYTVCEENKTVELHRVLYARMDISELLK
jgi:plasmid stabilization system protein ParE